MEVRLIRRMVTRRIMSPRMIQAMVTCREWRWGSPGLGSGSIGGVSSLVDTEVLWMWFGGR